MTKRFVMGLLVLMTTSLTAQEFTGTWVGTVNGVATTLVLHQAGEGIVGAVRDGSGEYPIQGQLDGEMATGSIAGIGAPLHFHAAKAGRGIRFTMYPVDWRGQPDHDMGTEIVFAPQQGGNDDTKPAGDDGLQSAKPGREDLDANLIGVWTKEDITSDPSFSYVTVTVAELRPDGSFLQYDGGSAGGTGSASVRTGPSGDIMRAEWRTSDGTLQLRPQDATRWISVARYYIDGNKLLLTYRDDGRREIWYRR